MPCCLTFNAQPGPINVAKASEAEAVQVEVNWYLRPLPSTATILTSTWAVFPEGNLSTSSPTISGLVTRAIIESGEQGQLYRVTNTITTATQTLTQELQVYVTATPTIFQYV